MSDDFGTGIFLFQGDQEIVHSYDLFGSAGILVLAILSNTSLVTDADRLLVESLDMCPDLVFRATRKQLSVGTDIIMISDVAPPVSPDMRCTQFLDGKVLRQLGRRTMNH